MWKKIFRTLSLLLAIGFALVYNISDVKAVGGKTDLKLSAKSAILIEASTGRILYEKNAYQKLPMASTTKIMTAILAIENCNLNDTVVIGPNASGVGGSSIWLSAGERIPLSDMLYGLMLASGNDAAVAIAEHVAGSVDKFVEMMNKKAQEIGAYNTNFSNPNGLPIENHYTTAYDLAIISAYAMKNDFFRQVVKTQYKTIAWEGHDWDRVVKNKNKILWQYEGGNGIKTGYTDDAGKCLSAAALRDGMQLISVVLSDPDMFKDSMGLMDYGFSNYSYKMLSGAGEYIGDVMVNQGLEKGFSVYTENEVYYPLTDEEFSGITKKVNIEKKVDAPVKIGQKVGTIDFWLGQNQICSIALKSPATIGENSYKYNLGRVIGDMINGG